MYRPLPDILTINRSPIEGLGLYAAKDIKANIFLGVTHIFDEKFENNYIRTPLGGFVNHSTAPNCEFYIDNDYIKLSTIRHINQGNELTAEYWLYDLNL